MITADALAGALYEITRPAGASWTQLAEMSRNHYLGIARGLLQRFDVFPLGQAIVPEETPFGKAVLGMDPVPPPQEPAPVVCGLCGGVGNSVAPTHTDDCPELAPVAPTEEPVVEASTEAVTAPETPRGKRHRK